MADTMTVWVDHNGYDSGGGGQVDTVGVTTFRGGMARGMMVQVTVGDKYVCMTAASAMAVAQAIEFASRNSVADHPFNDVRTGSDA